MPEGTRMSDRTLCLYFYHDTFCRSSRCHVGKMCTSLGLVEAGGLLTSSRYPHCRLLPAIWFVGLSQCHGNSCQVLAILHITYSKLRFPWNSHGSPLHSVLLSIDRRRWVHLPALRTGILLAYKVQLSKLSAWGAEHDSLAWLIYGSHVARTIRQNLPSRPEWTSPFGQRPISMELAMVTPFATGMANNLT